MILNDCRFWYEEPKDDDEKHKANGYSSTRAWPSSGMDLLDKLEAVGERKERKGKEGSFV